MLDLCNDIVKDGCIPDDWKSMNKFCCLSDMLNVDADAFVDARIQIECNKFRQLVPLLTKRDISLMRGRLYDSCVRSSTLHGSETWPVRKENDVALQRAEMRMVRWICDIVTIK